MTIFGKDHLCSNIIEVKIYLKRNCGSRITNLSCPNHLLQVSPLEASELPLVDIILKVPLSLKQGFDSILEDVRKNISPVLSVSEVLERKICYSGIYHSTEEHIEQSRLLKGSLISFIGVIERIEPFPFINGGFSTSNHHESFSKMLLVRDVNSSSLVWEFIVNVCFHFENSMYI